MAIITMTDYFSSLNGWAGNLLNAGQSAVINIKTATSLVFTIPIGHDFAGYNVSVVGTGFAFIGGTPTSGTMTGLVIRDQLGHIVLTVSGLAANTVASDLSLFGSNVFGWTSADGSVYNPYVSNAWSMLLSGNDVINGTSRNDYCGLPGLGSGNDTYNMFGGDDWILGGQGNDTINGGDGWDTFSFENSH